MNLRSIAVVVVLGSLICASAVQAEGDKKPRKQDDQSQIDDQNQKRTGDQQSPDRQTREKQQKQVGEQQRAGEQKKADQRVTNWVKDMAQHDVAEVLMAKIGMDNADNEQVRQFAQTLLQDHARMAAKVQQLAQAENIELDEDVSLALQTVANILGSQHAGIGYDTLYGDQAAQSDTDTESRVFERSPSTTGSGATGTDTHGAPGTMGGTDTGKTGVGAGDTGKTTGGVTTGAGGTTGTDDTGKTYGGTDTGSKAGGTDTGKIYGGTDTGSKAGGTDTGKTYGAIGGTKSTSIGGQVSGCDPYAVLQVETLDQKLEGKYQGDIKKLVRAKDSKDFDSRFIQTMITGHERAIQKMEQASERMDNQNVQQFAQQALPSLRQHLQVAENLQKEVRDAGKQQRVFERDKQGIQDKDKSDGGHDHMKSKPQQDFQDEPSVSPDEDY